MMLQSFGTVDTPQGQRQAMLCIDSDRPAEYFVHIWGLDLPPFAVLADAIEDEAGVIELKGKALFRPTQTGALFRSELNDEEARDLAALRVLLEQDEKGLHGKWSVMDGQLNDLKFVKTPEASELQAEVCANWDEFKSWASLARRDIDADVFRGHGSSRFPLKTTLHRAGRHRLERYCADTLQEFHAQAEAVLDRRLDMNDGHDYS